MRTSKPQFHNQIEKLRDQVNQEAPDDIAAFQAQKDVSYTVIEPFES